MIIKATYFVYKDVNSDKFPDKRTREYEAVAGFCDTDEECFGYLCQKAWEEKQIDEDVEKIEVICY